MILGRKLRPPRNIDVSPSRRSDKLADPSCLAFSPRPLLAAQSRGRLSSRVRPMLSASRDSGNTHIPTLCSCDAQVSGHHVIRRLMEPYKLEFEVFKKNNRGFEYFWAFDRTAQDKRPRHQVLFSDELQNITATKLSFAPQAEIAF